MKIFSKRKTTEEQEQEEEFNIIKEIIDMVVYIAIVVVLVFLIHNFVGQRTEVSGSSMENTLYHGDNLWIDSLTYQFKDPERFDIIIFPFQDSSTYYVKRIIGLPGETVYIDEEGQIFIDGELLEEDYGKEVIRADMVGLAAEPITLGEDEYFVMGDNRNNSQDSRRIEVGNVKRSEIEGKVVLRIWPFSRFGFVD